MCPYTFTFISVKVSLSTTACAVTCRTYTELPRTKPANAVARSVRTGVGSAETAIQITYAHVRARGEMHINASAC